MKFLLILTFLLVFVDAKIDQYAYRELHVLFQKADHNKDRFLDKQELNQFVERFMKRVPSIFEDVRTSRDEVEGGKVLADELFNRHDKDHDGKLSYRGSLLRKSDATNYAEVLEKVLVNLVHEISDRPSPFPDVNPFSDENRRKRETPDQEPQVKTSSKF